MKILLLVGIFLLSAYLVWVWQKYMRLRNYLDQPTSRSMHKVPTPRGGGVGIYLAFHLGIVVYWILTDTFQSQNYFILIGSFLVAGVGLLDDLFQVRKRYRILIHFLAAIIAYIWLYQDFQNWLQGMSIPSWMQNGLGVVWVVAAVYFINLFNFMDGINGLAGMETVFVSGSLAIFLSRVYYLEYRSLQIGLLAFAALGFLIWNFPRAVVFLGDCGSGFIGYILFGVGSWMVMNQTIHVFTFLILTMLFWLDATWTLLFRFFHKENIFQPHTKHLYQVLAFKWKSHAWVTILYSLVNILILFPAAFWIESGYPYSSVVFGFLVTIFSLVYFKIQSKEGTFRVPRIAT